MNTDGIFNKLIGAISSMNEVHSIGKSGGHTLPEAGESDIDLFIYCDDIPTIEKRRSALFSVENNLSGIDLNVFEGGNWGIGDRVFMNGIETWLMYFLENDTLAEIDSILHGERADREGSYYPIGRCAMFTGIHILYDKGGYLASMKKKLSIYPPPLAKTLTHYHMGCLEDVEDLNRAVVRKDAPFYHYALDVSLDHFLQALFALNKCYFPSRKRSMEYIRKFSQTPKDCDERLLQALKLGSEPKSISASYEIWKQLVEELKNLCSTIMNGN
jgi:hypothetical protein